MQGKRTTISIYFQSHRPSFRLRPFDTFPKTDSSVPDSGHNLACRIFADTHSFAKRLCSQPQTIPASDLWDAENADRVLGRGQSHPPLAPALHPADPAHSSGSFRVCTGRNPLFSPLRQFFNGSRLPPVGGVSTHSLWLSRKAVVLGVALRHRSAAWGNAFAAGTRLPLMRPPLAQDVSNYPVCP
jgi:hypothetical protein